VAIGDFLAKTASVEQQLKNFEEKLRLKADLAFDRILKHYKERTTNTTTEKLATTLQHLVSNELLRLEIECGFNTFTCSTSERVQTYVSFVNADSFRAQLRAGRHWKDPGVPGQHGEYTHRIQWYLLAQALRQEIGNPVTIFMKIGGVVDPNPENKPNGLWDALFDRNDGAGDNKFKVQSTITDGRSPESLTKFIIAEDNAEKWPLLHWFIKARLKKRDTIKLNNFGTARQYVESKIKKFDLKISSEAVVGNWRQFGRNEAPAILVPGTANNRTQGL
jgi:hypothetical protein